MWKKYKVYAINNYGEATTEFIKNKYNEFHIESLVDELEQDNGYHMRIEPAKNYIFYGDCDKFDGEFEEFAGILIDFLGRHYGITVSLGDISYTKNESVKGSYHYSIPKIYASCKKLQEIHEKFLGEHPNKLTKIENGKIKKIVDTSVYNNKWFRYPLQKKGPNRGVRHIIEHGAMVDFVVEY